MNAKKDEPKPAMILHVYADYSFEWLHIEPTMRNNLIRRVLQRALIDILKIKRDTAFRAAQVVRDEELKRLEKERVAQAEEDAKTKETEFEAAAAKKAQMAGLSGKKAKDAILRAVENGSFDELDEARQKALSKAADMAIEEAKKQTESPDSE